MKKRSFILISATIAVLGFSAFSITYNTAEIVQEKKNPPTDSTIIELDAIGINGGLAIDIRTGLKTEYVANTTPPDLTYMVRGYSNRGFHKPITRQKLTSALSISDLIENYPESWIKDYNSVVISGIGQHENSEATGSNATLTEQQKEVLKTASEIHIEVHYKKKNYNDKVQNRQMNTSFIVIPEVQAQFEGGYDKMIAYLKENSKSKINNKNLLAPQPTIYFVVNTEGKVEQTEITQTSGDTEIDKMLMQLLTKMPLWTPAKNANGTPVAQKFALDIGFSGC
jgi:hypothetical protein